MATHALDDGWKLLKDLEAQKGRLELHRGPASSDHGDSEWMRAAYGPWIEEWSGKLKNCNAAMDGPLEKIFLRAMILLRPDLSDTIETLAIGWTSVPILNACAVRRGEALAIALNHRLSNVFGAANAITWDIDTANLNNDKAQAMLGRQRLMDVLTASSKLRFDLALSATNPWPTRFHFWMSAACSHVQLMFVILHELGHVILGHLHQKELWAGHPLTDMQFVFLNSSHEAEYAADRFAIDTIMQANPDVWAQAVSQFQLPEPQNIFPPRMILKLIGSSGAWRDSAQSSSSLPRRQSRSSSPT